MAVSIRLDNALAAGMTKKAKEQRPGPCQGFRPLSS